jgi:hypothetical protein
MSKIFIAHDGYNLIQKKIVIGRAAAEGLTKQIEYNHNYGKLQLCVVRDAKRKRNLIEESNALLEQMLKGEIKKLDLDRYIQTCEEINDIDEESDAEVDEIIKRQEVLKNEMEELHRKIEDMEATIPPEQLITNYFVSEKQQQAAGATAYLEELD